MLLFALLVMLVGLSGLGAAFCGMPDLTDEDHTIMRQLQANTSSRLDARALSIDPIQVHVHVVTNSSQNDLYTDDVQKNVRHILRTYTNYNKLTAIDRCHQRRLRRHRIQLQARGNQGHRLPIRR